jgi:hypothetical protein
VDRLIVLYRDGTISAAFQLTIAVDQLSRASRGGGSAFDAYRAVRQVPQHLLEDARTKTLAFGELLTKTPTRARRKKR